MSKLPSALDQMESTQVYVAICNCNAVLRAGQPATSEFPIERLSCRECCDEVPAHLVTLPFRGWGLDHPGWPHTGTKDVSV